MNYCDENGCMNRKRNLVEEPIEMKNIHVLPTDNYSPLVHSTNKYGGYFKSEHYSPMKEMGDSYQNIYITIDEEIKEGDWVYCLTENRVLISNVSYSKLDDRFKIILTTDNDLIKNGVQAIDDEFLEWFVNNPSCEEIELEEIEKYKSTTYDQPDRFIGYDYKIIIPKEELKQETLEEVAHEMLVDYGIKSIGQSIGVLTVKKLMVNMAKWQSERIENESEQLINELESLVKDNNLGESYRAGITASIWRIKEWFEQFKRKA